MYFLLCSSVCTLPFLGAEKRVEQSQVIGTIRAEANMNQVEAGECRNVSKPHQDHSHLADHSRYHEYLLLHATVVQFVLVDYAVNNR